MKKNLFKLLSMALVVCMVLSLGGTAFADDLTEADKSKVQWSGTDIDYTPGDGEVNIQWEGEGIYINNNTENDASITVTGNVTQRAENSDGTIYTVDSESYSAGESSIVVNGNVKSENDYESSYAMYVKAFGESAKASVEISGDAKANSTGSDALGVRANAENGEVDTQVGGNAKATSTNSSAYAVYAVGTGNGETNVQVQGSASAEGGRSAAGIYVTGYGESTSNVTVGGDVSSNRDGACVCFYSNTAKSNLVIGGTLSTTSEKETDAPLHVKANWDTENAAENLSLTVWQIEPNQNGDYVGYDARGSLDKETAVEVIQKAINYIIKTNDEEGKSSLEGVTEVAGYQTAHEGDTVTVRAAEGYTLNSVKNDGKEIELVKQADGSYTLFVPVGGGVNLILDLSAIVAENPEASVEELVAEVVKSLTVLFTSEPVEGANGEEVVLRIFDGGYFVLAVDGEGVLCGYVTEGEDGLVFTTLDGAESTIENEKLPLTVGENTYELTLTEEDVNEIIAILHPVVY